MAELIDRNERADAVQAKLATVSSKLADEFRILLGEPPEPKNVPDSFWAKVQDTYETELAALLGLIFLASYDGHRFWGDMEEPSGERHEKRRQGIADRYIGRRSRVVGKAFVDRSKDMIKTVRADWELKTRQGIEIPKADIDELIRKIFGDSRMENIARTETQIAMVEGGDAGVIHSKVKVTRFWAHSGRRLKGHSNADEKPCTLCSPREGLPESGWGGERPGSIHDHCDCFIAYLDEDGFFVGSDNGNMRPGNNPNLTYKFRP